MYFFVVIASAALGFATGMRGTESTMRDPLTLVLAVLWLASVAAVLWLGAPRRPRVRPPV